MLIDFLPGSEPGTYIRNAGGAPANVAIAVSRNDLEAGFIGKVGRDDFGRFLLATLEENGVRVACDAVTDVAVTTMAFVTLTKEGERSFSFARKPGADMLLDVADVDPAAIRQATIVHAGSCSLSKGPAAAATEYAMRVAQDEGRLVSFDVNYRHLLWEGAQDQAAARIRRALDDVDLLKVSDEELFLFGGEEGLEALMREKQIALAVVTLGKDGARCHFKDQIISVPGRVVRVVDSTGAGDAFWGAFLSSLILQGVKAVADLSAEKIRDAMLWGNVAGSLCVQGKGAIPSLPTDRQIALELGMAEDDRK